MLSLEEYERIAEWLYHNGQSVKSNYGTTLFQVISLVPGFNDDGFFVLEEILGEDERPLSSAIGVRNSANSRTIVLASYDYQDRHLELIKYPESSIWTDEMCDSVIQTMSNKANSALDLTLAISNGHINPQLN